ncbi:multidrug effflux MFS transporter [Actinorugispora endophytica]|uniref:DHA1 family bicyclomycin/chloramphenicol resistance-like MFS transporter n=1 Tax=Actinorugispora endophytica TaxID=1605990 RepID=A0A4R6UJP4_9ACTN|nr:DHA1 family bicyclomycin/chloramphenicol resistance-like MFS transporter [Actinorugispora endophytica]
MSLTALRPRPSAARTASAAPAPGRKPRSSVVLLVFVLGLLSATSSLATDLYLPAFPSIAADLGATQSQVQLTLTAIMIGLAVGQLAIGPMSDRWGRRGPLLVGVAVFTLSSLACAVAPSVEALSVLRFVQGLAAAAGAVISRAVVRDTFDGDDGARFFSRLVLLVGLAPMLGPMLGGQLLLVGSWRLIFVALAVAGLVNLAFVFFGLPETLSREQRGQRGQRGRGSLRVLVRLLLDVRFIAPSLIMALSFAMTFTYISAFSFVSHDEFGTTPQQFSLIFGVNSLGMVLGNQVNAALIGRMDTSRRLLAGLVGSLASVGVLAALALTGGASLVSVTAVLFVMMFCTGLISPNATTLAIAGQPASVAGAGSALLGTLQFAIGGGLAAVTGMGEGGQASIVSMSGVMLATAAAALAVFVVQAYLGSARRSARV